MFLLSFMSWIEAILTGKISCIMRWIDSFPEKAALSHDMNHRLLYTYRGLCLNRFKTFAKWVDSIQTKLSRTQVWFAVPTEKEFPQNCAIWKKSLRCGTCHIIRLPRSFCFSGMHWKLKRLKRDLGMDLVHGHTGFNDIKGRAGIQYLFGTGDIGIR